jgi:hypothetical protein
MKNGPTAVGMSLFLRAAARQPRVQYQWPGTPEESASRAAGMIALYVDAVGRRPPGPPKGRYAAGVNDPGSRYGRSRAVRCVAVQLQRGCQASDFLTRRRSEGHGGPRRRPLRHPAACRGASIACGTSPGDIALFSVALRLSSDVLRAKKTGLTSVRQLNGIAPDGNTTTMSGQSGEQAKVHRQVAKTRKRTAKISG